MTKTKTKKRGPSYERQVGIGAQSLLIRPNDIKEVIGLSRRQCDRLEAAGEFPAKVRLGENSAGWLMSEVSAWVAQRAAERGAGKSKPA